nr:mechanosensitive ion channel domain-containing protein [uncultured Sphingomonas sp.]
MNSMKLGAVRLPIAACRCFGFAAGLLLAAATPAQGQLAPTPQAEEEAPTTARLDPFGRTTPAGTVAGLVDALGEQDARLAIPYLDLSGLSRSKRATATKRLKDVLDSSGRIEPMTRISDVAQGDLRDGLLPDQERVGTLTLEGQNVPLLLQRKEDGATAYWALSNQTLKQALGAATAASPTLIERWSPDSLEEWDINGAPASEWLSVLLLTAAVFVGLKLLFHSILVATCSITGWGKRIRMSVGALGTPLALIGAVLVGALFGQALGASIVVRQGLAWWFEMVAWLALGWLGFRLLDAGSDRLLLKLNHKGRLNATSIVQFAARLLKIIILVATLLAILNAAGFDVSAAIAALGIGGLALALGAQKTVENLIASLSILSDRPFRIGEVCRFGEVVGTVEDIGMRSSRIRTLDGTLLTIPNSDLSNARIDNLSRRSKTWFHPIFYLPVSTPPRQLSALLDGLREALNGDERLVDETARVRMLAPTTDRLQIEVFGYCKTHDFDAFLEVQEQLLLRLLHVFADHDLNPSPPVLQLERPRLEQTAKDGRGPATVSNEHAKAA